MNTAEKIILVSFLLQGVCCRDYSVSLPEKIEALSGSCVIIKCTFEIEDKYDKELTERATGCWLKMGLKDGTQLEKTVFNSSMSSQNSIIKGNITGRLQKKDCTTIFYDVRSNYSGDYYFRIEGEGRLKYTYSGAHVQIEVIVSPKPTVKQYEEQKEVLEGISVNLRCSAETLCSSPPPTLTWSSTPRIPLNESSRQQELISDLNFTATHRHHRVTFTCTITYQLLDQNKTAQDNITLDVQYAPKVSSSSSCNRTGVSVYVCEVDGNPFPELEWHLSGRPVTNSSNMFISEERLNSTGLRSSITLHQSLSHTSTLECVSNNTRGTERKLLCSVAGLNLSSLMIGVAVGVVVLVITFCAITCFCVRKKCVKRMQTRGEGATRSISTSDAVPQENKEESIYSNIAMSSAGTATENPESLIYSSIDLKKCTPVLQEFGSISSCHSNNAVVKHCSGGVEKAEISMGESSRAMEAQVIVSADQQTESKDSEEELFADSSQLYAKVIRRKPQGTSAGMLFEW